MAFQVLLNFFIAFMWMFLQNTYTLGTFAVGFFFGLLMIFGMRRFFSSRFYFLNVLAVLTLLMIFIKELIKANLSVLQIILTPKMKMTPGIFAYQTELKKDWEITVLSNLITLTPGTLVVEVSADNQTLYIHAMDIGSAEEAKKDIRDSFEKAIKEVSR
ncbi:Na+/H+ antiporter subunit E [Bacillus sp. FJAT-42376]|uniref:Na+/H+ antiporter subunit E n=1 Tax=Bacillus sp. FJAT-42376 TaxID=2014076 RepID=UPI000F4EB9C0|nr:Na+/H+ antiporter subunit E [Bacillus sp. FJAT-42376]AZB44957.1 Na+/H+ antiporter subunit E [Bacillus sp. FJAT-42376]